LTTAFADQIVDTRQRSKVRHTICDLLRQRIIGIACGYEDANDFDTLAADPALMGMRFGTSGAMSKSRNERQKHR
jgi:hypothetical protein